MNVTDWPAWCRLVRAVSSGCEVACRRCLAEMTIPFENHRLSFCPVCGKRSGRDSYSESEDAAYFCGD